MPVFTRSAWIPRMQTGVLSAPVPAVVGMAMSGLERLRRRAAGTDRRVEVLGQVAVVGREQVHRLGRVDDRPAADGDVAVRALGRGPRPPASRSDSSVGSMWTPVKVIDAMPAAVERPHRPLRADRSPPGRDR